MHPYAQYLRASRSLEIALCIFMGLNPHHVRCLISRVKFKIILIFGVVYRNALYVFASKGVHAAIFELVDSIASRH